MKPVQTRNRFDKLFYKECNFIHSETITALKSTRQCLSFFTGNEDEEVKGTVFKITSAELLKADSYEVDDYERIEVILKSGIKSWVYVGKK